MKVVLHFLTELVNPAFVCGGPLAVFPNREKHRETESSFVSHFQGSQEKSSLPTGF